MSQQNIHKKVSCSPNHKNKKAVPVCLLPVLHAGNCTSAETKRIMLELVLSKLLSLNFLDPSGGGVLCVCPRKRGTNIVGLQQENVTMQCFSYKYYVNHSAQQLEISRRNSLNGLMAVTMLENKLLSWKSAK